MKVFLYTTVIVFMYLVSCTTEEENSYRYPNTSDIPTDPKWVEFKFTPEITIQLPDYPKKNEYDQMTEFAYKGDQFYSAGFIHTPIDAETGHDNFLNGRLSKYPSTVLFEEKKEINGVLGTEIIYEFEPYEINGHQMPDLRHEFIYNHKGFTMLLSSWYFKKDETKGKLNATRFVNSIQITP